MTSSEGWMRRRGDRLGLPAMTLLREGGKTCRLTRNGKLGGMSIQPQGTTPTNPIGSTVKQAQRRRAGRSAAYRAEQQRLAPFEEIARIVIARRGELGLTQQQLAQRMGTSHSAISRIESGQHPSKPDTLRRLAHALELRFVIGFESGPAEKPVRQLVSV